MKRIIAIMTVAVVLFSFTSCDNSQAEPDYAEPGIEASVSDFSQTLSQNTDDNTLKYYLGSKVNAGKDNGYSERNNVDKKDPHFGWDLGKFFVSGYTRVTKDGDTPVFIKNLGDTVTLWFNLEQDINNLNGEKKLSISEDKKGYDKYFEIPQTNFGHGTLIIKHMDYQGLAKEPTMYTDYLPARTLNADADVELFEEGDYEVALNYKIKNDGLFNSYTDYRIYFKFAVRNGNCMVYPFDVITKSELSNTSVTANGFYLDLAKSRYLDINIKREVLTSGLNGLVEDARFNRPAKDGDEYTEEGIYTIKVINKYTNETTEKEIFVGENDVLKAHFITEMSLESINEALALGAYINDDGTIVYPEPETTEAAIISETTDFDTEEITSVNVENETENRSFGDIVRTAIIPILVIALTVFVLVSGKNKVAESNTVPEKDDETEEISAENEEELQ